MKEIFFKCTLISDIVLNSKLATEGNMTTLDFIPGSNFLGIAAKELYKTLNTEDAYSIFHSGDISFGDAIISENNDLFYPLPFDLMMKKGEDVLGENKVYLQHILSNLEVDKLPKDGNGFKAQLKQKRNGYVSSSGKVISKIKKTFVLKSAQDAHERRSKEGAMFGFESLKKGQEFIFSLQFQNEDFVEQITSALVGRKRIGKSKTAEFGQVDIEVIKETPQKIACFENSNSTLVYAQSNLCFLDKTYGQSTYQPTACQLGLNGEINWEKSQIRIYSYSPWNGQRNTTDTQRNCIAAGSVFFIEGGNEPIKKNVGEFQSEGLGRIIVNPVFLKGNKDDGLSDFFPIVENQKSEEKSKDSKPINTDLGKFLEVKSNQKKTELELSKAIQDAFNKSLSTLKNISPSQWGSIRNFAMNSKDIKSLKNELFLIVEKTATEKEKRIGYLTYGVAYDKYWSKNGENSLKEFKKIFIENEKFGTTFIAKFAAEMAKASQRKKEVEHAK